MCHTLFWAISFYLYPPLFLAFTLRDPVCVLLLASASNLSGRCVSFPCCTASSTTFHHPHSHSRILGNTKLSWVQVRTTRWLSNLRFADSSIALSGGGEYSNPALNYKVNLYNDHLQMGVFAIPDQEIRHNRGIVIPRFMVL